ncbi:MAG: hypothetical protein ACFB2W_00585 [Leptolyngbyaceae cyanobacterium]
MISLSDVQSSKLPLSKYLEELTVLTLENISALPEQPGVYFLFSGKEICYVGRTAHLSQRVTPSHSVIKKMGDGLSHIGYILASKYFVKVLEASCIETFNPSLNQINNGAENSVKTVVDELKKYFDKTAGYEKRIQSLRHTSLDEWAGVHKVQAHFDISFERAELLLSKLSGRAVNWGDGLKVKIKDAEEYLIECHARKVASKKLKHETEIELGFYPKGIHKLILELKEEDCIDIPLDFDSIWQLNKARSI